MKKTGESQGDQRNEDASVVGKQLREGREQMVIGGKPGS